MRLRYHGIEIQSWTQTIHEFEKKKLNKFRWIVFFTIVVMWFFFSFRSYQCRNCCSNGLIAILQKRKILVFLVAAITTCVLPISLIQFMLNWQLCNWRMLCHFLFWIAKSPQWNNKEEKSLWTSVSSFQFPSMSKRLILIWLSKGVTQP